MALTYAELSQAVQDYCQTDEATFVTNMPRIVQQAEDRILNAAQLPFFRKACEGNLSINNAYLTLPTDYLSPYSLAVDNTGYEYLSLKDVSLVREMYPVKAVTGVPKYYAVFSDTSFIVGPTPNMAYDIEIHYFYRPETIVTASTTWLGTNAESVLLYGCIVEGYTFLKGNPETMGMYDTRYMSALAELKDLAEGYSQTDNYRGKTFRAQRR